MLLLTTPRWARRQAVLPWLLDSAEPSVAPFVVQLLGEYVLEIVVDIAERIERDVVNGSYLLEALSQFAHEPRLRDAHRSARTELLGRVLPPYVRLGAGLSGVDCHLSHQRVAQRMDRALVGMTARMAA